MCLGTFILIILYEYFSFGKKHNIILISKISYWKKYDVFRNEV